MFYNSNLSKIIVSFFFALFFSPVFFSCNKPTLVGKDLLPSEDEINTPSTDTLTLITTTVREDSVRTDNFSTYILGTLNEPVFGKTYAHIFTQILLPTEGGINLNLPDSSTNLFLDSAVLTLGYKGFYGDTNSTQSVVVYELAESMDAAAEYYSTKKFSLGNELGRKENFLSDITDSVQVNGVNYAPHLRIKLSDITRADSLLHQSGTTNFQSSTNFLTYFKGICIASDPNSAGKGLMSFDLNSPVSKLTLYYHTDNSDSLTFSFLLVTNAASSNYFYHNYSSSTVEPFLNNPNVNGDSMVFIQPMAGLKTKIKIPYLQNLGNILINKAELIITEPTPNAAFTSPLQILCARTDDSSKNLVTADQFYGAVESGYFDGKKITKADGTNEYRFNLALHFQTIVNNPTLNYGLFLIASSQQSADRLMMAGNTHSQYKMELNLVYTKP